MKHLLSQDLKIKVVLLLLLITEEEAIIIVVVAEQADLRKATIAHTAIVTKVKAIAATINAATLILNNIKEIEFIYGFGLFLWLKWGILIWFNKK
jgi:hypothetical protein